MRKLYLKSKSCLTEAGFKVRKFVTNSEELHRPIGANEQDSGGPSAAVSMEEEDQSYAKGTLGVNSGDVDGRHKILGVVWDFIQDAFTFNIGDVSHHMESSEPTKRNVVNMLC